jgi:hypothetical protein
VSYGPNYDENARDIPYTKYKGQKKAFQRPFTFQKFVKSTGSEKRVEDETIVDFVKRKRLAEAEQTKTEFTMNRRIAEAKLKKPMFSCEASTSYTKFAPSSRRVERRTYFCCNQVGHVIVDCPYKMKTPSSFEKQQSNEGVFLQSPKSPRPKPIRVQQKVVKMTQNHGSSKPIVQTQKVVLNKDKILKPVFVWKPKIVTLTARDLVEDTGRPKSEAWVPVSN